MTTTQIDHPWRTTARSAVQFGVALCAILPALVSVSGLPERSAVVVAGLAVAGGVTRVMALPATEVFLRRWAPWLSAAPPSPPAAELDPMGAPPAPYTPEHAAEPPG